MQSVKDPPLVVFIAWMADPCFSLRCRRRDVRIWRCRARGKRRIPARGRIARWPNQNRARIEDSTNPETSCRLTHISINKKIPCRPGVLSDQVARTQGWRARLRLLSRVHTTFYFVWYSTHWIRNGACQCLDILDTLQAIDFKIELCTCWHWLIWNQR